MTTEPEAAPEAAPAPAPEAAPTPTPTVPQIHFCVSKFMILFSAVVL